MMYIELLQMTRWTALEVPDLRITNLTYLGINGLTLLPGHEMRYCTIASTSSLKLQICNEDTGSCVHSCASKD